MIGGGIILLVGLGLMIKKYPKATIGSAAILFVLAYFFLGIMGRLVTSSGKIEINNLK